MMGAVKSAELPQRIGERYRPLRVLGRGGMGTVYEAEHVHTGERVAVKVLSAMLAGPEAVARFKREARTFAAINSPHLARITDAGTASELDDAPFFAMELLVGEDLAARLAREGPQLPDDVASWIEQAARALAKAHELGIVHRDLKPANLFVARADGGDVLKVLDFGVAKISDTTAQTATGAILGTPRYMAPEQARGEGAAITPAADAWSIAMITFALLAGRPYFQADGVAGVLSAVLFDPIKAPSLSGCDLGAGFDAWFIRSTDRDPSLRFQSVTEQAAALSGAIAGQPRLAATGSQRATRGTTSPATLSDGDATAGLSARDASGSIGRSASLDVTPPPRPARARVAVAAIVAVAASVATFALWPTRSVAPAVDLPAPSIAKASPTRSTNSAEPAASAPAVASASSAPVVSTAPARVGAPKPAVRPVIVAPTTPTRTAAPPAAPTIDPFATQK